MTLEITINGINHTVTSDPDTPLVYILRDELGLKGTKLGCGLEQCGACAVLVGQKAVLSCTRPVAEFAGSRVITVEGLSETEIGKHVQAAFIEANAAQCGYCTAGLVVAVTALLKNTKTPDPETTKTALEPHLCRCGAHPRVLRAVEIAGLQI